MWSSFEVFVGVAAAIVLAFPANAQGVLMERQISMAMAKTIAEGAVEQCRRDNYHVTATVLDRAGQVRVILRDDGSSPATIDTSRRKAYTARVFRQTTAEFAERVSANPALKEITDVITLAGGVPISPRHPSSCSDSIFGVETERRCGENGVGREQVGNCRAD